MSVDLTPILERLYALVPRGAVLGLERTRAAAEKLGDVHKLGRYVHIAGTNGKGSTAAFVATMAERAGMKVGLYTSPHLTRFAERIRIGGKVIADEALERHLARALDVGPELTFFEVATLAALSAFREAEVDLAILEVGLGGRLDATNVVEGNGVQAITRVAFDHVERLGESLSSIAREKAGILRAGSTVVVGRLHPDARAVVDEIARKLGAMVHEATDEEEAQLVDTYPPSLAGSFQRQNAMVAAAIALALDLPVQAIAEGLVSTRWPGRCEVIETGEGYVLLDCAHNPDGALALKNALLGLVTNFPRRAVGLVFGAMADKNWKAMLDRITQVTGPRVYVEPRGREAVPIAELARYMEGDGALSIGEALSVARQRVGRSGIIIVTGSIYLVGQARAYLLGLPADPPVAL